MSAINNNRGHYKTISSTCYTANIAYLILRVFYFVLFLVSQLYIMAWVTLGTIAFYLFCFLLMKKKKYYLYALLCGNEFFAFVIVATVMLGFNTGFHFYILGLSVVSFFTTYFSKQNNTKNSIIWAGLSLTIYLLLYFLTRYNGPYYVISNWLEMTLFTTHIVVAFLFVIFYLIVFLKYALSLEKKIMNESRTDELTQISNRYGLYDCFNQESDKRNKVLALFDIDDFKKINDTYGHIAGDYILKQVAEITVNTLKDDFVCRYGGEEFVIVLDKDNYLDKLENLRKSIEQETFEYENNKHKITITVGTAPYSKDISLEKWVELADEKMYTGKNTGKNKVIS